jgi:methyltransferase-like protein 6
MVFFHESRDFDWEELRLLHEPALREQQSRARAAAPAVAADTEGQISGWERHFQRHVDAPTPFFKERRALLEEFPLLKEPGIRILEVGSGNGSSVLPLLRHNLTATVHATDPSQTAVADTEQRVAAAGLADRLTTELQPSPTMPCSGMCKRAGYHPQKSRT